MEGISAVCRQFKLLRESCNLNIEYSLTEYFKHLTEKAIIYLNYDDKKTLTF